MNQRERIQSNRKTTKGRKMYYQSITDTDGNIDKTIKHIQLSPTVLKHMPKIMKVSSLKNRHISSQNARTILSKKRPGIPIWDSANKGTYVRKLHGELK